MIATAFDFSSLPSFLSYGIPGLVLGLIVAALFGAASMKVTEDRLKAIKLVLQYGLAFVIVATIAVIIPLFVNPRVTLHVVVDPDQRAGDPQARAIITSDLTPVPNDEGTIVVQQSQGDDFVKVDVTRLVYQVKQAKQSVAMLKGLLDSANMQLVAHGVSPAANSGLAVDALNVPDMDDAPRDGAAPAAAAAPQQKAAATYEHEVGIPNPDMGTQGKRAAAKPSKQHP